MEIPDEAKYFNGPTVIGSIFESSGTENAAASYYSGYIARKLISYHGSKLKVSYHECSSCASILTTQDLELHLFVSFKQYVDNVEPN